MAEGATDHAGTLGASLDAIVPASKGAPPFSYLLAAWVNPGTSIGREEAVRATWANRSGPMHPALVFPTIGLSLFAADSIKAVGASLQPEGCATGPANAGRARGSTPTIVVNAPCSLVSNFLQKVIDAVFDNLKLNGPTGSTVTAKIGSFFVNLWNTAVSYAKSAVTGLTSAVLNVIVGKITAAAAAAATIAEVVSNITPWSVRVAAVPTSVDFGSSGTFQCDRQFGRWYRLPTCRPGLRPEAQHHAAKAECQGRQSHVDRRRPALPDEQHFRDARRRRLQHSQLRDYEKLPDMCGGAGRHGEGTITITRPAVDQL